jgi:hypothetical protein
MMSGTEGDVLAWTVRPFRTEPAKGISALVLVAASIYFAARFGGVVLGGLAALILIGGTGPFFVSTRYRLTPEGVEVNSPFQKVKRPWAQFRRAYVGRSGVSLSPFRGRHLLEPYRSVMLRYGSRRESVLEWVARYGPGSGDPAEVGS